MFFYSDLVDALNAERERRNAFEKPEEDVQIEMSFKDATLYWCEEDPAVLARQLQLPANEHVLFVMEYFDSGTTMMKVLKTLTHYSRDLESKGLKPKKVKTGVLLHYKSPFNQRLRKKYGYFADYIGFMIPDTVMVDNARGPTVDGKTPYHICTYGDYEPPHHPELRFNTHKWSDAFTKFDED